MKASMNQEICTEWMFQGISTVRDQVKGKVMEIKNFLTRRRDVQGNICDSYANTTNQPSYIAVLGNGSELLKDPTPGTRVVQLPI